MNPVPGLTIEEQPGDVLVRLCMWAEARGEPVLGRLAVWWVVSNRSDRRDETPKEVVLARNQFSWTRSDDPNRSQVLDAWKHDPNGWLAVDVISSLAESGYTTDPTSGATEYYNPALSSPSWGRGSPGWKEHTVIGHHVFGVA
jgi:spore germination cell wall hydrolase CwlJ-like protein